MPSTKQCLVVWKDEQRSWKNHKDRKKKKKWSPELSEEKGP